MRLAHGFGIAATGADIVEDPFLVAKLFLDVFGGGLAQPLQTLGQPRAAGHQQRHRVFDVVIGLGKKGQVLLAACRAGQRGMDDGSAEQVFAGVAGLILQLIKELHGVPRR